MFPRHTSISVRVIFGLVLGTSLLMLAAGIFVSREMRRVLLEDLRTEHAARAQQLAVALALPAWNFDREQLGRVLDGAMLQTFVVRAAVALEDRANTRESRTRNPAAEIQGGQILVDRRPIQFDNETIGTVELQVTTALMEERLRSFHAWMIGFGLVVDALLVGGLYFLLWRSVLRPLGRIERFAVSPDAVPPAAGRPFVGELERLRAALVSMLGQLRDNEARLRLIGDNLPDTMLYQVIRETDGRMQFTHVSAGAERVHGLRPGDILRDASLLYGQIVKEDRPAMAAAEAESLATMGPFNVTVRMRRADGALRWVHLCSQPRRLPEGRVAWDGIEMDVTARKLAEQERERLAMVIDAHEDAALWFDAQNRLVYVNDAACRDLGYTREELLGSHLSLIAPRINDTLLQYMWEQLRTEGSFHREGFHRRKDGTTYPVEVSGTYVRIDGQELNCGFVRDITARQSAEQDLKRQLDELRRWQQVTLTREERIAQLKTEVNDLCRNQGAPERYRTAPAQADSARGDRKGETESP